MKKTKPSTRNKSHAQKIKKAFDLFDGQNLETLDLFYDKKVHFLDPVVNIKGLAALKKYYSHAYKNLIKIEFDFKNFIVEDFWVSAVWVMTIQVKNINSEKPYEVQGCSQIQFNRQGLVCYHRDYFDLGELIYEKIPVQGNLIRGFKKFLKP